MLNKKFAQAMNTDNAHLYLKCLREEVILELGLNQDTKPSQMSLQSLEYKYHNMMFNDPENVYNLHGVNNEHAIGYENLFERAAANNPGENYQAAHESVFDKLLADYFLSKRGEYKELNNMAGELSKIFEA